MADKIKLKKEDIEGGAYELPEGYEFRMKATRAMLIDSINKAIVEAEAERGELPTDAEVLTHGKAGVVHPYYEAQLRLDYLNDQLKNYE